MHDAIDKTQLDQAVTGSRYVTLALRTCTSGAARVHARYARSRAKTEDSAVVHSSQAAVRVRSRPSVHVRFCVEMQRRTATGGPIPRRPQTMIMTATTMKT